MRRNAPIRVLLVELPPLLRGMLDAGLASQPGIELVRESDATARHATASGESIDLIIVGLESGRLPEDVERDMARRVGPRVLGIETGHGRGVLYALRPHRTPLGELSIDELPELIRSALGSA